VKGLSLRALRLVALLESLSFAVLLVGSLLKRTTDTDLVPVLGPLHGGLYVLLVLLVLDNLRRLRWAPWFALVMLTVGSPGAHFAVAATPTELERPRA
jgi:integral membrane protein